MEKTHQIIYIANSLVRYTSLLHYSSGDRLQQTILPLFSRILVPKRQFSFFSLFIHTTSQKPSDFAPQLVVSYGVSLFQRQIQALGQAKTLANQETKTCLGFSGYEFRPSYSLAPASRYPICPGTSGPASCGHRSR